MRLRSKVVPAAIGLSHACGGPLLWNRLRGGKIKVLMYHGISGKTSFEGVVNHYGYNLARREFERQMAWLNRRCNVVSLQDMAAGRNLSTRRANVVITFDDGYENLYSQAFPVLRRYNAPAVIGLPTAFVAQRRPLWNDVVEFAVSRSEESDIELNLDDETRAFSLQDTAGRLRLYEWLLFKCVTADQQGRNILLSKISETLGVNIEPDAVFEDADYRPLTRGQVVEMQETGLIEFASHSVRHLLLAKLSTADKRAELTESKRQIEEMTGIECASFCVPGGSYDAELLREAERAGYALVLTSDTGSVQRSDRVLKRNCILRDYTSAEFADTVCGPVFDFLQARRQSFASR